LSKTRISRHLNIGIVLRHIVVEELA
jgi:hypothetical protein